ncbi:MAG: hypothetical protein H0W09_02055 [Solirubrobacterales bacterium]|nr:hypothetical protein [Solirubrobacterales bacterium]
MTTLRRVLACFFTLAGVLHFVRPETYEAVVPPGVPLAHEAVLLSGAAEIIGGLALLSERTRLPAAWSLIALLIAVFPANVYMALSPEEIPGLGSSTPVRVALWLRLPLQALLIWLVWRAARRGGGGLPASSAAASTSAPT